MRVARAVRDRLVVCAALVAWAAAWSPSSAQAQTADEIAARHADARGRSEQWQAVRTLRMTGRATAGPGREALVVREVKRPNRVRTEFTFQGITGVFAFDGRRGWQVSPLTGIVDPRYVEPDAMQVALDQSDIDGPLAAARLRGATLTLHGQETVAGRTAWRLRATPKDGPPQDYLLDAETYLMLRTDATRQIGGRTVQVETLLGDHRSIGGLVFPHTLEMSARDSPTRLRIVVESIEINPRIDDGRFKAPSGTRR